MRYWLVLVCCLWVVRSLSFAQETQTPYQIALERIAEAEATDAIYLNLSGFGLTQLPPEIGILSNLRDLRLDNNQLTSLPPEIGSLRNLYALNLLDNQLSSLPTEIGNLSNLRRLYLSNNQLSSLPPEISNLSNLQYLELNYNSLSNLLPEIGSLNNLRRLYLSNNQLSSLPPEIGKLSNLCFLELSGNRFQSIPLEVLPLKRLGTSGGCYADLTFANNAGLYLDEDLLEGFPEEIQPWDTSAIMTYLENPEWWHLRKLLINILLISGSLALLILGWKWRYHRVYKSKKKRNLD